MSGVGEGLVIMDTMERMQIWKRETSSREGQLKSNGYGDVSFECRLHERAPPS